MNIKSLLLTMFLLAPAAAIASNSNAKPSESFAIGERRHTTEHESKQTEARRFLMTQASSAEMSDASNEPKPFSRIPAAAIVLASNDMSASICEYLTREDYPNISRISSQWHATMVKALNNPARPLLMPAGVKLDNYEHRLFSSNPYQPFANAAIIKQLYECCLRSVYYKTAPWHGLRPQKISQNKKIQEFVMNLQDFKHEQYMISSDLYWDATDFDSKAEYGSTSLNFRRLPQLLLFLNSSDYYREAAQSSASRLNKAWCHLLSFTADGCDLLRENPALLYSTLFGFAMLSLMYIPPSALESFPEWLIRPHCELWHPSHPDFKYWCGQPGNNDDH